MANIDTTDIEEPSKTIDEALARYGIQTHYAATRSQFFNIAPFGDVNTRRGLFGAIEETHSSGITRGRHHTHHLQARMETSLT